MKYKLLSSMPALSILAALAIPGRLPAQPQSPRYIVNDLGKPGLHGSNSLAFGINALAVSPGRRNGGTGAFTPFFPASAARCST